MVSAIDEDFANDDPIANFVVRAEALAAGADPGTPYQFNVANQTGTAVIFVGINLIPE